MSFVKAFGLVLLVLLIAAVGVVLVVVAPRWYAADQPASKAAAPAVEATAMRKIRATLFFVSEDGERLVPVEREVPYGQGLAEQARQILNAEIGEAPAPLISAIPADVKVRGIYTTDQGDAFVDLSGQVVTGHPGGSLNELLTVYSIVNALTANLPAIHAVQVLVDGHEVDTLKGHVDLRRPLAKSTRWVDAGGAATTPAPTTPPGT